MSKLIELNPIAKNQQLFIYGDRKYSVVKLPDTFGFYAPHIYELAQLMSDGSVDVIGRFESAQDALVHISVRENPELLEDTK